MDMTMHMIESTNGVRVALHHVGGAGKPLLICHATGFHGRAYDPMAVALMGHFDVWAIDLRGHGASTAPESGDFAWVGMAEDVAVAIDHIDSGPVIGVGHSLGGASILLAELERPGLFAAAYLYEPIVFPSDRVEGPDENPMSGPARKRRPVFPSKQAAIDRYGSRPPLNVLRVDALAAYVEHGFVETETGEVRLACEPEAEARTFEATDKMTLERLDGLELPLVVAAGAPVPGTDLAAFAAATVEGVAGARLCSHPELGHFGPLEDPDRIAQEVIDWLAAPASEQG
jgi:pimeloyl-ACP methyl ester carboxylesterase